MKAKLNPAIIGLLAKKTGLAVSTIPPEISRLQKIYPKSTPNAVAQIFAMQRGKTIWQKLSAEDRASLPNIEEGKSKVILVNNSTKKKQKFLRTIIKYETVDHFKKGHIDEINNAYTNKCYTSVFILTRKVLENLVIEILTKKFPPTSIQNKELYYDVQKRRFKDFSVILKNLYDKRHDFEPHKVKIIERLYREALKFKDEANDATHSWYHLVESSKEIDDLNIQSLIELIKAMEN